MKRILLFGTTGSIGTSTLDVIRAHPEEFQLVGISGHTNAQKLERIAKEFDIKNIFYTNVGTCHGMSLQNFIQQCEPDIILNAVSGFAGLAFSIATIESGIPLALANKESLVAGGSLLMSLAREKNVPIYPVDSEHSALWQCLSFDTQKPFRTLYLTCSGGPFRTQKDISNVTKAEVLTHPTWNMGPKVTVDSATLANKCLEVFEAMHLFQAKPEQIQIVIHPQSIVHSLVEFEDTSLMAQMSPPDMRLPIALALSAGMRKEFHLPKLDFTNLSLEFEKPDKTHFPILALLDICAQKMQNFPIVFNAANEVAVQAFLEDKIPFSEIVPTLQKVIETTRTENVDSFEKVQEIDRKARIHAQKLIHPMK